MFHVMRTSVLMIVSLRGPRVRLKKKRGQIFTAVIVSCSHSVNQEARDESRHFLFQHLGLEVSCWPFSFRSAFSPEMSV